jgi:hypothetical protein
MSDHPNSHGGDGEREAPSADQFEERHESHIPWDDDAPIVREDEEYERLGEPRADTIIPDPYERGMSGLGE